jgi:hypothetical protein
MRSRLVRVPVGLLAGVLLIALVREAAAETWRLYENARYGTAGEYPADLFRPGRCAQLAIFAGFNIDNHTPANYEQFLRSGSSDYQNVTYRATGGNWLILSGYRGGSIFYEKYIFALGKDVDVIHGIVVTYGSTGKARYDPIVARMARSLRPSR